MLGLHAGVGGTYVVGEGGRGCETVRLPTTVGKCEGEACGVSERGTHPASWTPCLWCQTAHAKPSSWIGPWHKDRG